MCHQTHTCVVEVSGKVYPGQVREEFGGWMSFDTTKSKSLMNQDFIFGQINDAIVTMKDIHRSPGLNGDFVGWSICSKASSVSFTYAAF